MHTQSAEVADLGAERAGVVALHYILVNHLHVPHAQWGITSHNACMSDWPASDAAARWAEAEGAYIHARRT